MQELPYELLQLIASYLLPYNQCRLSLTSKYHYKYLYTSLLKWHAHKAPIAVPKHNIWESNKTITILVIPLSSPRVVLLEFVNGTLFAKSLTDMCMSVSSYNKSNKNNFRLENMGKVELCSQFRMYRKFDILAGYYQYIHKDALLLYVNMRQPIFSLNYDLKIHICRYLSNADGYNMIYAGIL